MMSDSDAALRLAAVGAARAAHVRPLYVLGSIREAGGGCRCFSTAIAAGAVWLLLRTDFFDRAAVAPGAARRRILAAARPLYVVGSTLPPPRASELRRRLAGRALRSVLLDAAARPPVLEHRRDLDGTLGSHLGVHFSPTLLLLAPLYALWPSPLALVAAQALVVALAMVPLYRLLERDMGEAGAR
jgi:hypothetical protein